MREDAFNVKKGIAVMILLAVLMLSAAACSSEEEEKYAGYTAPSGKIAEATSDENGKVVGGEPGDQRKGKEVKLSGYEFTTEKGYRYWKYVVRCTDPAQAAAAADFVQAACENDKVGYNNYENTPEGVDLRNSLFRAAEKVGFNASAIEEPVDVSCTPLILTGYSAAGIEMGYTLDAEYEGVVNTYTCRTVNAESLREAIELVNANYADNGEAEPFEIIEMNEDQMEDYENNLKRGDMLCTGHHTAMVM